MLSLLTAVAVGCGDEEKKDGTDRPVIIDERRGGVDGLRFGASREQVIAHLGPGSRSGAEAALDEELGPLDETRYADYGGPESEDGPLDMSYPELLRGVIRYRHIELETSPASGLYAATVVSKGSQTKRGLRIGDPLPRAQALYPRLTCGVTDDLEGYRPVFRFCEGCIGPRVWGWIGQDPIRSISISRFRYGRYATPADRQRCDRLGR